VNQTEQLWLGEKLAEHLVDDFLTEADTQVKKVVAVYPGRFQPAGAHHAKTYKWIQKKFKDSWVVTSNKVDGTKSPLNFKEKKMVWLKHGVKNIIQAREPYKPKELLKKYDSKTTAVVFVYGAKEGERLKTTKADGSPAYYQYYEENKNNLKGYEEHGYVIVAPHISIKVLGGELNGTRIRKLLGKPVSPKYTKEEKIQAFKDLFGWYNEKIFKYLTDKFATLFENIEFLDSFLNEYPMLESTLLNEISSIGGGMGIGIVDDGPTVFYPKGAYQTAAHTDATKLGFEVANYVLGKNDTSRNLDYTQFPDGPIPSVSFFPSGAIDEKTPMNQIEFEKSQQAYDAWSKFVSWSAEKLGQEVVNYLGAEMAVRKRDEQGDEKDSGTHTVDVNDTHGHSDEDQTQDVEGHDETAEEPETKKKNVHMVKKENQTTDLKITKRITRLLLEGGAAGHMSHPFDDMGLTFGDLKEMIRRALTGNLHVDGNITEKLDGQALSFSWKNGKVIFARNKGQLENDGAEAPDVKALTQMFSDRPENIRDAFVQAANDLQSAIAGLSDKQKDRMFKEGQRFMAVEVMTPKTQNIIPQNKEMLVFHGLSAYDEAGKATNLDREGNDISSDMKGSGRMLAGMIKQINADVQDRFEIHPPVIVSLPKSKDFEKSQQSYFSKLDKLKKEFRLRDSDQLMMYHQSWWENFITKSAKKHRVSLTNDVMTGLIKRWAFFDKGYAVKHIRKGLSEYPEFLDWVLKYDKGDHSKQAKENMLKLELIFLQLGGEVMQNVSGFLAAGGREDIAKEFRKTASELQKSSDIKVLNKYKLEMRRLEAIGGLEAIVPSEGIVFEYKGGIYKLTGAFAPINQLNGIVPGRF
jgi:hypothetical protein